jgi:hypothetical protein
MNDPLGRCCGAAGATLLRLLRLLLLLLLLPSRFGESVGIQDPDLRLLLLLLLLPSRFGENRSRVLSVVGGRLATALQPARRKEPL